LRFIAYEENLYRKRAKQGFFAEKEENKDHNTVKHPSSYYIKT